MIARVSADRPNKSESMPVDEQEIDHREIGPKWVRVVWYVAEVPFVSVVSVSPF